MEEQPSEEVLIPLSSDECGHSGGDPDSDEDVITDYHISSLDMLPRPGPLPTISVTPHSPASKIYPVLEDSLQQVRELHESVHHMRNVTIQDFHVKDLAFALNPLISHISRLSSSCPALNEANAELDALCGSLGSSPLHQPPSRKGSSAQEWLCQPETHRRRSWTALEDLTIKDKIKGCRQRSISLSSMESEADESSCIDNIDGSSVRLLGSEVTAAVRHRAARSAGGATSTHSLNEADLQSDFNKVKAKREAEQRLLPQRLTLQKSISTPSIIAVRDLAPEPPLTGTQPTLPMGRPSGTESETEEEGSRQVRYPLPTHLQFEPYDTHSEKRRKRGSIFFRKRKDKNKKDSHHSKDSITEGSKSKSSKSASKQSGFTVSLPNSKNSFSKRGSSSFGSHQNSSSNSQILCDDKDSDSQHGHHDSTSFPDDVPLVPLEFLSDSPLTAADLCTDISLGLHEIEPDSWTPHVGKEIARKLKEKEVKRQEHIYEFILTEKHHCMTLLVMQKIFVEGLQKYFQLGPSLERMFPRLADLTELHLALLSKLRQRQKESPVVQTIADILLEQFSNQNALKLKSAYGDFCSRHRDAVEIYKCYLQSDPRFGQFVRHCQNNPLLKKKGIPECILFITQRLTKYPLLIEPLIKTSKENKQEQETLQKALVLIKEILVEVDAQVAEKEKEDRKLEIYNRIDAKSYTVHRDHKFKKSDILQGNRTLKFEGVAMLMQGRSKMQIVLIIVLSDVLFFLQENSHKYTFFTPDNKAGVVSLQKLLVREKAGQDSRGIYLISSNPADPEMFELKVHKPKDKQIWIHAIRDAVQACPEDDEDSIVLSAEEKQSLMNARQNQIRHLVGLLRQKDIEQALLLEEKMSLQLKLLTAAGIDPPSPPSYRHLVNDNVDTHQMWKEVLTAVQEVSHLSSSLYTTGTNLSRSVSSVGEHQSDTYVSPSLPKRAETFGGNSDRSQQAIAPRDAPNLITLGRDQQYTAIQLSHYVYTLLCIISQLMTTNESYQAQIYTLRGGGEGAKQYRHNQQLEELRNLQDKLSGEKAAWAALRDQETKELEEKKAELLKLQEQIRCEQEDIKEQREQLFRKMEKLTNKGLIISPNVGALPVMGLSEDSKDSSEDSSPQSDSSSLASASSQTIPTDKRKDAKWSKKASDTQIKSQLPLNLMSTTNQQKASSVPVKQQIPLKLASRLSSGGASGAMGGPPQMLPLKLSQEEKTRRTSTSGYQRLSPPSGDTTPTMHAHSRTGSSPAMMQGSPSPPTRQSPVNTKPARTHTYPKIAEKLKQPSGEEEVIYF